MQQSRGTPARTAAILVVLLSLLVGAAPKEDPLLDRQYHLRRVRAPEAWEVRRGGDQVIAVIDTGVDHQHPDLQGRLVPGVDLVDRGTPPDDANGHGTFVAGIASANLNNGKGGAGVAPRAKIMPVRVLDDEGEGRSDVVAEGIRWATRRGATVINLSLADVPSLQRPVTRLITTDVEDAIREAAARGVVVVAAAGNEGETETPYSDDLPALVVGATDRRDRLWEHSNYDRRTLFAPGVGIISTYVETPYAAADGTSFSAPIVSAGAALLRQHGLDAAQTRVRLRRTARPVGEGVGRVDVAAALGVAPQVRTTPSPAPPQDDEPKPKPRTQPRPVTQPSPIAPVDPEPKPRPRNNDQPRASQAQEGPTEVAQAEAPKPKRKKKKQRPVEQPTAANEPDAVAAIPGVPPPTGPTPLWPVVVAGVLLFFVSISLGGYWTARRSGG